MKGCWLVDSRGLPVGFVDGSGKVRAYASGVGIYQAGPVVRLEGFDVELWLFETTGERGCHGRRLPVLNTHQRAAFLNALGRQVSQLKGGAQ